VWCQPFADVNRGKNAHDVAKFPNWGPANSAKFRLVANISPYLLAIFIANLRHACCLNTTYMTNKMWNKVLIVDDEPAIRLLLVESLRSWGYVTLEAETGAAALAAVASEQVAALLLDINLPDSYSLDLLPEIKRRRPQMSVIMITAESLFENAVAALRGGADDFITKPINLEELRFALDHTLRSKAHVREPIRGSRQRVLIISDSSEHIPYWQAAFESQEAEITSVVFPEEWKFVKDDRHDLAVIDVGPSMLEPLLKNIRASKEHAEIHLLVEKSRIAAAPLVGVLPKYRAMPCSQDELIRLARRRLTSIAGQRRTVKALL
jgi:CheY-like chemotaxis protein